MKQEIEKLISTICMELFKINIPVDLTRPDERFGDFATNVALQIAKKLNKNPHEVAESIAENIRGQNSHVQDITIAGPGFLNITLTDAALITMSKPTIKAIYKNQKIVIETNNPNPFKDIHIGHAFNSIVADTVANLLEVGQGDIHRISYHGDVGLHIGKSLWAIFDEYGDDAAKKIKAISPAEAPSKLRNWYAHGASTYEIDKSAKTIIENYAKQSFSPSGVVQEVYDICKNWSFSYFDLIFAKIGSRPIERRYLESETDKAGREIVESNTGTIFEKSEGAVIFRGEKYDKSLHTRVFISKAGNTLYESRDLGLIQLKAIEFKPLVSYIVTAIEQKEYFRVVFKAAELAIPKIKTKTINIPTGTVKLTTGKMSSRTGDVVTIEWLFDQLESALRKITQNETTIGDSMVAALRYSMLKGRIDTDTIFDIDSSVSLQGNSGPYLQYAHARARSILAKSLTSKSAPISSNLEPDERSLLRKICEYSEAVDRAVDELMPHHVCTYLYELAQVFNRFYEQNRVLDDPRQNTRLILVKLYADTLKNGLKILNIPTPNSM